MWAYTGSLWGPKHNKEKGITEKGITTIKEPHKPPSVRMSLHLAVSHIFCTQISSWSTPVFRIPMWSLFIFPFFVLSLVSIRYRKWEQRREQKNAPQGCIFENVCVWTCLRIETEDFNNRDPGKWHNGDSPRFVSCTKSMGTSRKKKTKSKPWDVLVLHHLQTCVCVCVFG